MDVDDALKQAAREFDLQDYYLDIVKPLLTADKSTWPLCCGGGCEPCMGTVCSVADRTLELLKKTA